VPSRLAAEPDDEALGDGGAGLPSQKLQPEGCSLGRTTDAGFGYGFLNGTSMSSPHAAGVAALISQLHPEWNAGAVKSAVERTPQAMSCPANWQPLGPSDERQRCYGSGRRTSFFGAGMVDALAASNL
jgi:subtilisin family serine protease